MPGSQLVPWQRFFVFALPCKYITKAILFVHVAMFGRLGIPIFRLLKILLDTVSHRIHPSKATLGDDVASVAKLPIDAECITVVAVIIGQLGLPQQIVIVILRHRPLAFVKKRFVRPTKFYVKKIALKVW